MQLSIQGSLIICLANNGKTATLSNLKLFLDDWFGGHPSLKKTISANLIIFKLFKQKGKIRASSRKE